jgi:hypothetical protein
MRRIMGEHFKLGTCNVSQHDRGRTVRMFIEDRRRHLHVIGKSGSGKSVWLANVWAQEAASGRAAILIDHHGDLAQRAPDLIPTTRINKTLVFKPSDRDWPVAFNIFDGAPPEDRSRRASDILAVFQSMWAESWSASRMQFLLMNAIAALLEAPGSTILGLTHIFTDLAYRERILQQVKDPLVLDFFRNQLPALEKEEGPQVTAPVLNRMGQLLLSPILRNIIAQPRTAFDPRYLIDHNYLIIVDLSNIGEIDSHLLGSLIISTFGSAAMSRSDIKNEDERKDVLMIVDEFPRYTCNFKMLLSEVRKFRMSLILSNQYLAQLSHQVKEACQGNVGSTITFRIGSEDTETFARHLDINPQELNETHTGEAWCRYLNHGHPSSSFLLTTPPPPKLPGHAAKVIQQSRRHFSSRREDVENKIARFLKLDQKQHSHLSHRHH